MTHNATTALRAAMLRKSIGEYAARRMVERAGCPLYLLEFAELLLSKPDVTVAELKMIRAKYAIIELRAKVAKQYHEFMRTIKFV